jgi:hypothetical protein
MLPEGLEWLEQVTVPGRDVITSAWRPNLSSRCRREP